jgi:capsular polysaccharide biosynthesis protein
VSGPPTVTDSERIELRPLLRAVWRRVWVILLCAGLAGAAALIYSLSQDKEYEATAQVFFRDPGLAQGLVGPQLPRYPAEVVQDVATNTALTQLDEVADRTADAVGSLSSGQVSADVEVGQSSLSNIYDITARTGDPALSAALANTYAKQAIAVKQAIDRRQVDRALQKMNSDFSELEDRIASEPDGRPTDREAAQLESLRDGIRGLTIFRGLQDGNVTLVQTAVAPTSASSPKPLRDTAYGILLGAVLGVALALLFAALDRRLTDPQTAERVFGLPVLAVIRDGGSDQAYRDLLAQLRYASAAGGLRSLGVASATAADESASLSRAIAATAAGAGARTVLVDAANTGVVEAGFDVIGPGDAAGNAAGFLDAEAFRSALDEAESRYEFVVVNAAPMSEASAALPVLSNVAAIVAVGRIDHTLKSQAKDLARQVAVLGPPVLGLVLIDGPAPQAPLHKAPAAEPSATESSVQAS